MHDKPTQDALADPLEAEFAFYNRVLVIVRTGSVTTKPDYVDVMEVDVDFSFPPIVVRPGI